MERIIIIDGTSNVGKTTLCENIEKNIQKARYCSYFMLK